MVELQVDTFWDVGFSFLELYKDLDSQAHTLMALVLKACIFSRPFLCFMEKKLCSLETWTLPKKIYSFVSGVSSCHFCSLWGMPKVYDAVLGLYHIYTITQGSHLLFV